MIGSTRRSRRFVTSKAALAVLLAGSVLTACKQDGKTTTMDSKGLWIANGTNVLEYIPGQLSGGTRAAVPHLMINSAAFGAPQGVTFDAAGNLWVMDPAGLVNGVATPALFEFSAAQLAALAMNAAPEPVATITSTALVFPQQSVFDASGNQWVSDHNNNTVMVFTAAQLAATGANIMMPAVVITAAQFNGPLGIAFDGAGNLWVANNGGVPGPNNTTSSAGTAIFEFAAAHLPAPPSTGMLTPDLVPDVILSDDGKGAIQGPWALAFDASGNLWSSNANTPFTLVEFAKSNLAATGAPMPVATVSSLPVGGNPTLNSPNGLCFDNGGDLAAMNSVAAFGFSFFAKSQLVTGMPTPNTFIIGAATTLNAPAGCVFGPLVD